MHLDLVKPVRCLSVWCTNWLYSFIRPNAAKLCWQHHSNTHTHAYVRAHTLRGRHLPIMPWNRFVAKEASSSSPVLFFFCTLPVDLTVSGQTEPLPPGPGRSTDPVLLMDVAAAGYTGGGPGCTETGGGEQHGRCSREGRDRLDTASPPRPCLLICGCTWWQRPSLLSPSFPPSLPLPVCQSFVVPWNSSSTSSIVLAGKCG